MPARGVGKKDIRPQERGVVAAVNRGIGGRKEKRTRCNVLFVKRGPWYWKRFQERG